MAVINCEKRAEIINDYSEIFRHTKTNPLVYAWFNRSIRSTQPIKQDLIWLVNLLIKENDDVKKQLLDFAMTHSAKIYVNENNF